VRVCPKCGGEKGPLLWVERKRIGGRVYLYAIHPSSENKSGYTSCYLGPEGEYEYVSRLHAREGLVLRSILDEDRALDYLERLIEHIENKAEEGAIDIERLEKLVSRLAEAVKRTRRASRP